MSPLSRRRLCVDAAALSVATPALLGAMTGTAARAASGTTTRNAPAAVEGFTEPAAHFRPKIRYWWPCGEISAETVDTEIREIAARGFSAAEIQCIFTARPMEAGWGSDSLNRRLEQAVEAGARYGVRIDLTVGPAWPLVVPGLSPDGRAAAQELAYGRRVVESGATFTGAVPAAPAPHAGVTKQLLVAVQAYRCEGSPETKPTRLVRASRVDLTDSVHDGVLSWTAPNDGGQWILLGFWQRGTGQAAVTGQIVSGEPAYVVDHFGAAGVRAATGYWDTHVLTPRLRRLVKANGGELFEDSLELDSAQHWTWNLAERFAKQRGYSLLKNLPVLFIDRIHRQYTTVTPDDTPDFVFTAGAGSSDDLGVRVREDYYRTLTELYVSDHLEPLRAWAHDLGLRLRAQPYGTTIDTPTAGSSLDINETESLGTSADYDDEPFRWVSAGAVHLSGREIYSMEGCATLNEAYAQTWPDMLKHFNAGFAHGVNQVVYHGFATATGMGVSGWPGFAPFTLQGGNGFSEAWGPRQPTWADTKKITDWTARMQWALRQGRPLVDLAVYRHRYDQNVRRPEGAAGYTYDFTGPDQLAGTRVGGGRLAPDGPAYGALLLDRQPTLPLETARLLLSQARAGLPVVIVGELPTRTPGARDAQRQDAELAGVLAELLGCSTVRRVAEQAAVGAALKELGVRPRAEISEAPGLLSVCRMSEQGELYFLHNPTSSSVDADVLLEGAGRPYVLDAWAGDAVPLGRYRASGGRTAVPVALAPGASTVIALSGRRARHATATSGGEVLVGASDGLRLRALKAGEYTVTLDDGGRKRVSVPAVAAERRLNSWQLTVEDWRRGVDGERTVIEHKLDIDELKPWAEIPELRDTSGRGSYTTTVSLDDADGAYLLLGRVTDTFEVSVNGTVLPPPDQISRRVDLGGYLRKGANTIVVRVATPLRNRLRVTAGFPGQTEQPRQDYGLMGPVTLMPYRDVAIRT